MSPESFSFTLTLPRDARLVGVVRDLCAHAAAYAQLPDEAARRFSQQVTAATERAVEAGGPGPCRLAFDCQAGALTVTVADETLREPLTA